VRSASTLLRPLVQRRGLCAVAATPPVVNDIRASIVTMKTAMETKPDMDLIYTAETFEADKNGGKINVSKLSSSLDAMDASAKKVAMKCITDSMAMEKEMADQEALMSAYDWSQWEGKGLEPETIAEVKGIMSAGIEMELKLVPDQLKASGLEGLQSEVTTAFKGAGGFLEIAAKEELAAKEGMAKCLADMEKLEVDAVGLRDVTIADILEREPELRAEIEEEIKNNNWGY